MKQILVLYYSRTGNTERMAKAVAEGAKINDEINVELTYHVEAEELEKFDAILVGTPTYHHEMAVDFKNLFDDAAEKGISLKGKLGATFGSYGWSGEAPNLLATLMKDKLGMQVSEAPLIVKYVPDERALNSCRDLGKRISERLINSA